MNRESVGVCCPYDPFGADGKPVKSLSYRNVLSGSGSGYHVEKPRTHFVRNVSPDDYPMTTSFVWSGLKNNGDIRK